MIDPVKKIGSDQVAYQVNFRALSSHARLCDCCDHSTFSNSASSFSIVDHDFFAATASLMRSTKSTRR